MGPDSVPCLYWPSSSSSLRRGLSKPCLQGPGQERCGFRLGRRATSTGISHWTRTLRPLLRPLRCPLKISSMQLWRSFIAFLKMVSAGRLLLNLQSSGLIPYFLFFRSVSAIKQRQTQVLWTVQAGNWGSMQHSETRVLGHCGKVQVGSLGKTWGYVEGGGDDDLCRKPEGGNVGSVWG